MSRSETEYLRVDYEIVWDVATKNVPKLVDQIEQILKNESAGS